jgi:hypothetical protein
MDTTVETIIDDKQGSDALQIIKTGLIVYIEDCEGNSCAFGVKNVVNHELCLCQALGKKKVTLFPCQDNMVQIVVPEENGAHLIPAKIEESSDNNVNLTLRPTNKIDFIQRRRYYRLADPNVKIQYQLLHDDGTEYPQLPVDCLVWDISGDGAGLMIRSTKQIHTGNKMQLRIDIPEHETMQVTGEVVRVVVKSIIRNESLVGVQFKEIEEPHRDKLLRYITQMQLSLRKRKKR